MILSTGTCLGGLQLLPDAYVADSLSNCVLIKDHVATVDDGTGLPASREVAGRVSAAEQWDVVPKAELLVDTQETQQLAVDLAERRVRRLVRVNPDRCRDVAAFLHCVRIPETQEEVDISTMWPREVGNFYFALVAICHQTSPRARPALEGYVNDKHLRGWDYLLAKFRLAVAADQEWLRPRRWRGVRAQNVCELFRDSVLGDTLSDPAGRAALLRDLGRRLTARRMDWVDDLHSACAKRAASGYPNLLHELSRFKAYSDPIRKKSLFFLGLMRAHHIWDYCDSNLLGPPVDYHEVRGHLRVGTVEVIDPPLMEALVRGDPVDPSADIAIRGAVYEAIMRIAEDSNFAPDRLHYLFWNVFRSLCTRMNPQCVALPDNTLPSRYRHLIIDSQGRGACPFAPVCRSRGKETPILEHLFETDFY